MYSESPAIIIQTPDLGGQQDVTDLMWPNWSRESLALGGDFRASTSFAVPINQADKWAAKLGWNVIERWGGVIAFHGKIQTVMINKAGSTSIASLDNVWNAVRVRYKTTLSGSDNLSSWYTDGASIARYGRRERELSPRVATNSTGAAAMANSLIARYAWPTNEPQRLSNATPGGQAVVTVTMIGHIQALQYEYHDDSFTNTQNASDAVTMTLGSSDSIIQPGDIRTNTTPVTRECDGDTIWNRLKGLAEFGDGSTQWIVGCYGGYYLDFKPIPTTEISYYAELGDDGQLRYFDQTREIPGALLKPGRIVWRRDLLPGVHRAIPLVNDTRATLIGSVRINRGDVQIEAMDLNPIAFYEGMMQSLAQEDPDILRRRPNGALIQPDEPPVWTGGRFGEIAF